MDKEDYRKYYSIFPIKLENMKAETFFLSFFFFLQNSECGKNSQAPHSMGLT